VKLEKNTSLTKKSIQSMNHSVWLSSLARLGPNGICDKVFESSCHVKLC